MEKTIFSFSFLKFECKGLYFAQIYRIYEQAEMPTDILVSFDKFMHCVRYHALDQRGFSALKEAYPGQKWE